METLELDPQYATTRRLTRTPYATKRPTAKGQVHGLFAREDHPCHGGLRVRGYFKPAVTDRPLITVITAVFNGKNELEATLDSVLAQKYDLIEHIVVDGGSQDGTVDILRRYDDRVDYWFSEPDKGISDAWNKAIELASGEYVSFLNAGDEYLPDATERVAEEIGEFHFSWGDMFWVAETGDMTLFQGRKSYREVVEYVMPFNHPTMFFKRSVVSGVSGYSTACRYAMDYDLVRKIVSVGGRGTYIPATIAMMKAGGVHDLNYKATVAEVKKIAVSHGTHPLPAWFAERYTLLKHRENESVVGYVLGAAIALSKGVRRWLQPTS